MKILWFTWKDMTHPFAGGAELVNERLAERLAKDGHEVTLLVGGYPGCKPSETINGYKVIRLGGPYSVYWKAYRYYKKNLADWADIVIEEVNTLPFFTRFYVKQPRILFFHQLCREIWFYQLKLPFSLVGYFLEPIYLRMLATDNSITISDSTKEDLCRHGFTRENISVISEGFDLKPVDSTDTLQKYINPTLLSLGSIRPMKRTMHQVKAFELAKVTIPNLEMKIAGDATSKYGKSVLSYIASSKFSSDIHYLGRVSNRQRTELMQRSYLLLATSIKEGWGLTVTEAASQGTPAAVYDVDGLRDSTHQGKSGIIALQNTPSGLADTITSLFNDPLQYSKLSQQALESSYSYTFDRNYQDFRLVLAELQLSKQEISLATEKEVV